MYTHFIYHIGRESDFGSLMLWIVDIEESSIVTEIFAILRLCRLSCIWIDDFKTLQRCECYRWCRTCWKGAKQNNIDRHFFRTNVRGKGTRQKGKRLLQINACSQSLFSRKYERLPQLFSCNTHWHDNSVLSYFELLTGNMSSNRCCTTIHLLAL